MDIGIDSPFTIDPSPEIPRDDNSEGQQALDRFDAASPLLFRQRDIFNILVYDRRLRHGGLHNKGSITREFYTVEIVALRNQAK